MPFPALMPGLRLAVAFAVLSRKARPKWLQCSNFRPGRRPRAHRENSAVGCRIQQYTRMSILRRPAPLGSHPGRAEVKRASVWLSISRRSRLNESLAVGGTSAVSHAQRRTSAVEAKNAKYKDHLRDGKTTKEARQLAVQDTVEHLGHSRHRKDLADAYLRRGLIASGAV